MVKNLPANAEDTRHSFDPWFGKTPWRRKWLTAPIFLLENLIDRGVGWATVHGVAESDMTEQLSNLASHIYVLALTKSKPKVH